MKKVHDYIGDRRINQIVDIDFHDFVALSEMGFSKIEIARELGVSESEINKLMIELEKNY